MAAEEEGEKLGKTLSSVLDIPVPKTKEISFENTLKNVSEKTKETLRAISNARRNMTHGHEKLEPSAARGHIETYIPCLLGVKMATESMGKDLKSSIRVYWKSTLGTKYANRYYLADHWQFEVVMTLCAYGLLSRQMALHELDQSDERGDFQDQFAKIAKPLCEAAGIFDHLRKTEVHAWICKEPVVEKISDTFLGLSIICLAEAQQLAVRRAVSKKMTHLLIAKLCVDVFNKYTAALELFRALNNTVGDSIRFDIIEYCEMNIQYFKALHMIYIAFDEEQKTNYGKCIGLLNHALESLKTIPKQSTSGSSSVNQRLRNISSFIDQISHRRDKLQADNASVYYQPIATGAELDITILEPKCLVRATEFKLPDSLPIHIDIEEQSSYCIIS